MFCNSGNPAVDQKQKILFLILNKGQSIEIPRIAILNRIRRELLVNYYIYYDISGKVK